MTGTATPLSYAQQEDRDFFERELASFVPDRVFDAHCHVWNRSHMTLPAWYDPMATVGYDEYSSLIQDLHPGRQHGALFIPSVRDRDKMQEANSWTAAAAARHPDFRNAFFLSPKDDPEWVRDEVRRLGASGLKCYHTFSDAKPTWEAHIPDYLPESMIRIAHEESLTVTLHMVRTRSVADPENIRWIRHYCEQYPNMTMILAHSARAFQPAHALEGLPQLTGLDNLYCDSSANCEQMAHQAIIRILGHDKLLYGSDLCASHDRGRSLGTADSFLWLYNDSPHWKEKHTSIRPVLIGLEHLRSLKWACWSERLTDSQVEDIFWNNAAKVFGIGN